MANKEIKTTIKLAGEAAYKKAVKDINGDLSVLNSEMKRTNAEFANNEKSIEALTKKGEILQRQYEEQKKKAETLRGAVEDSTEAYKKAEKQQEEVIKQHGAQSSEAVKAANAVEKAKKSMNAFTIQMNNAEIALGKSEAALRANQSELDELNKKEVKQLIPESAINNAKKLGYALENAAQKAGELGSEALGKGLKTTAAALAAYASAATAAATAAGGMLIGNAEEQKTAVSTLTAALGATEEEAQKYKEIAQSIYLSNWGDSFEDVATKIGLVRQQMKSLSDKELREVVESGYALQDVYGIDFSESLRGANSIVKQFGTTASQAFNLIAQGAEKGLNQNEDIADQIAEYATYYANLGFTAEEAFNIMAKGAETGVYQIDKINDAVKEFSIRSTDNSETTNAAFTSLGLNASEISKTFAEGGEQSARAFNNVLTAISEINDAVSRESIGVALFGTQWEDLGESVVLSLRSATKEISTERDKIAEINESVYASFGNTLSRIKNSVSLGDGFSNVTKELSENADDIAEVISNLFGESPTEDTERKFERITKELAYALNDDLQRLLPIVIKGIDTFANLIGEALPSVARTLLPFAVDSLKNLAEDIIKALPEFIPKIINSTSELIISQLPELIDLGLELVIALAEGIGNNLPLILERAGEITDAIINKLSEVNWVETGERIFIGLGNALVSVFTSALGIVDSLLGTEFQQMYDDFQAKARQIGADIYQMMHAEEIDEREDSRKANVIENQVTQKMNDYIRAGKTAKEAVALAVNDVVVTNEDAYLYNAYVKSKLEDPVNLNAHYELVKKYDEMPDTVAPRMTGSSATAEYYMQKAGVAVQKLEAAEKTTSAPSWYSGKFAAAATPTNITFNNYSPTALSPYEQAKQNELELQAAQRYSTSIRPAYSN